MRWLLPRVFLALVSVAVIADVQGQHANLGRLITASPFHQQKRAAKRATSAASSSAITNQRRNAIIIKMQIQEKKGRDSKEQRAAVKHAGPGLPKQDDGHFRGLSRLPGGDHPRFRRIVYISQSICQPEKGVAHLSFFITPEKGVARLTDAVDIPYQVAIGKRLGSDGRLELACGGALVAREWVLTAAHCVDGIHAANFDIALGKTNLDKKSPQEQWFTVKQIILHKNYQKGSDHDDIALIRLDNSAAITNGVKLVHLPETENMESSGVGTISGWGAQRWKGPTSPLLKKVNIPILSSSQSERIRGGQSTQIHAEICAEAGEGPGAMEACGTGDSGGPLVCSDDSSGSNSGSSKGNSKSINSNNNAAAGKGGQSKTTSRPYNKREVHQADHYFKSTLKDSRRNYVCGIVSHSTKCYKPGDPAVFTKVSHYLDWIQKTIGSGVRIAKEIQPDKGKLLQEYPFLAVVNRVPVDGPKEHRARCMGTMLNEIFILTAADCLVPTSDHVCYYWVGFGNHSHGDESCVRLPVADFFLFDPSRFLLQMADPKKRDRGLTDSPNENRNKPVVLQLARSIATNERAFPVHLPTANNFIGLAAKVISFANSTSDASSRNNKKDTDKMIAGEFVIVDRESHCPDALLQQYNLNRSTSVCAKRLTGPPCSEYLPGSPLVCQSKLPSGSAVIGGDRFLCGILAKPRTNGKPGMDRDSYVVVRQETGNGKKNALKPSGPEYCVFRKLWVNEQRDSK